MRLLRKPALYLVVLACVASLAAGGRLSLRLIVDTAITLAALPVFQVVALAVVYWTGRRPVSFGAAVDEFFSSSWPLFLAFAVLATFAASASPLAANRWFDRLAAPLLLAALATTARLDFAYFRDALARAPRRAGVDVMLQRAIAWTATVLYLAITAAPKAGSLGRDVVTMMFGARP